MADDIRVRLSADIAQFVDALNKATTKIESSVKDMSGNMEKMAQSSKTADGAHKNFAESIAASVSKYAAGAAAGFTVAGAIAKIGDAAVAMVMAIPEAIRKTGELADTFKKLSYETGASLEQLNTFHAAMLLEGQNVQNLEGLFTGAQRAIKANADALVLNGVAASEAALRSMPFEAYLRRVDELSGQFANSTERSQFLMAALGKAGIAAGADLHELVGRLGEAKELTKNGGPVSHESIRQMEEAKAAAGRLALAEEKYAANVSSHTSSMMTWWNNTRAAMLETGSAQDAINTYVKAGLIHVDQYALGVSRDFGPMLAKIKALREEWEKIDQVSMDVGVRFGVQNWNTKTFKEPDKPSKPPKAAAPYVDNEALSLLDVNEWSKEYLAKRQATFDKDAEAAAKYAAKIAADRAEWENAAFDRQRQLATKLQATWEQNTAQGGMMAYLRETKQAMKEWGSFTKAMLQGVEGAFSSTFNGILTGQMTISQAMTNLWQGLRDAVIGMISEMLAKWVVSKLAELILGKSVATSEAAGGAAAYAVAAMQSVAAIPMIGWAMAPGVGAAAYGLGMSYAALASAAGGWDQVPSDQLAMIHKNEKVLPADIADAERAFFKGGKGGGLTINVSTVDANSFEAMLLRNQDALLKVTNRIAGNRRKS